MHAWLEGEFEMRKLGMMFAVAAILPLAGCQGVASHVSGIIYLDSKGPITAQGTIGAKSGKACAQTILSLIGQGDASIEAAAANGGIKTVTTVDYHATNLLGIIGTFCTVVRGN
jgi:hypothetical protein